MWMTDEDWADIAGHEGTYWVSTLGRVMSRPRHTSRGGLLKINTNSSGYAIVSLSKDNKINTPSVHTLVMKTFVGPCPAGLQVCHRNGDPMDSALHNLRYDTPSSNQADRKQHGTDIRTLYPHCPVGHEFTKENTYYSPQGWRSCRECRRLQSIITTDQRKSARRSRGLKYAPSIPDPQREEVRIRHAAGESQASLATTFGVSRRSIYRIIKM